MQSNLYITKPIQEYYDVQYSEQHRAYHNLMHISNMFIYADYNDMILAEEQIAAIFFHDFFYDIPSFDILTNEEQSAIFAYDHMRKHFDYSDKRASIVKNIILDTREHVPVHGGDWSTPVIDLDLWGLYDITEYKKIAWLVRKEYGYYNWKDFSNGRKKWLKSMVSRDSIYCSPYAKGSKKDTLAFKNLNNELKHFTSRDDWTTYIRGNRK